MTKYFSNLFLLLLLLAFLLRLGVLLTAVTLPQNSDVVRMAIWAENIHTRGLSYAYQVVDNDSRINYPPGSVFIIYICYWLSMTTDIALPVTIRLPSIFVECFLGGILYLFTKKLTTERRALLSTSLFLFNPVALYTTAFWGQIDVLHSFFFFLAFVALTVGSYKKSTIFLWLSLYMKLLLVFLIPLFLVALYQKLAYKTRRFLLHIGLGCIPILLMTLPISFNPIFWLVGFMNRTVSGESPLITTVAFNFWWVLFAPHVVINTTTQHVPLVYLTNIPLNTTPFLGISLFYWGLFLFVLFLAPIFLRSLQRKHTDTLALFLAASATTLIGFLFLPNMHERYIYPFFLFMAAVVGLSGKFLRSYVLLSLLHFLNLYIAWHPLQFFGPLDAWLATREIQWLISVSILGSGLYLYFRILLDGKQLTAQQ